MISCLGTISRFWVPGFGLSDEAVSPHDRLISGVSKYSQVSWRQRLLPWKLNASKAIQVKNIWVRLLHDRYIRFASAPPRLAENLPNATLSLVIHQASKNTYVKKGDVPCLSEKNGFGTWYRESWWRRQRSKPAIQGRELLWWACPQPKFYVSWKLRNLCWKHRGYDNKAEFCAFCSWEYMAVVWAWLRVSKIPDLSK